jgi:CDP-diacylglycerol--glycerol-3-phosphate 3-phosphatidyltransferase/cardiolipin synthase
VLFGLFHTAVVGRALIWIAAFITLWSMVVYLKAAWQAERPAKPK